MPDDFRKVATQSTPGIFCAAPDIQLARDGGIKEKTERLMKRMWSTAFVVAAMSSAAAAQSGREMSRAAMTDAMATTYTGCVEAVNHGGTFMLTHVGDDHMGAMHDDTMKKKDDSIMKKAEPMAVDDMHMHAMAPDAFILVGKSELKKHVGQKVSVTGSLSNASMDSTRTDLGTLTVSALKVVGKSCS